MATTLLPELSNVNVAQDTVLRNGKMPRPSGLSLRQECEILRAQGEAERSTFLSHWLDLAKHILPRRIRLSDTDVNKGDKRNHAIVDSTATEAAGTLAAGMMSGLTSPATEWFRLAVPDDELSEQQDVKEWLREVQKRMEAAFEKSNLYDKLPLMYGDLGTFGTHAMAVLENSPKKWKSNVAPIRFEDYPIGSYWLAHDEDNDIQIFGRTFRMTVNQIVRKWGDIKDGKAAWQRGEPSPVSFTVQQMWNRGHRLPWILMVHIVRPNETPDPTRLDPKYKAFESIYYELGTPNTPVDSSREDILEHSGFDEFPLLCPRWEVNSEDIYGTNCPGMRALGDIKQLQLQEKRVAQALEKTVSPPLVGPSSLRNTTVSMLPGGITYDDSREGIQGLRPLYEVKFDVTGVEGKSAQIRNRINRVFFADLFLMLTGGANGDPSDVSTRRQITAREIDERHEEKLLALGPVLQRLNRDVFDPLINRTFQIMARKGLIPPPPQALVQAGTNLKIEYVSIMAQAQKQTTLGGMERLTSFALQMYEANPGVLDVLDMDELITLYAEGNGVAPKIVRDAQQIAQMRAAAQQKAAQQQMAENLPGIAKGVKDLSQAPLEGNNALATLLGRQTARTTLGATASPPVPVAA